MEECQTLAKRLLLVLAFDSQTQFRMQPTKPSFELSYGVVRPKETR